MKEGMALYRQGRYREALETLLGMDVRQEDHADFIYYLGLCYLRLGKNEEALLYLEQMAGFELEFAREFQCRMLLGYAYGETGRFRLSIIEFRKLLEDGMESVRIHAALGHILYRDSQVDESLRSLGTALRMDPANPNAMNSLGYVLADQGRSLPEAYGYCSRAVRSNPRNPAYLDSLAWVLHRRGDDVQADRILRKAMPLAPGNPVMGSHLKEISAALGSS